MTLFQQAQRIAIEVSELEGQLIQELRNFAAAVVDAGLGNPLGHLEFPVVLWEDTRDDRITFELRDCDRDIVLVHLPAAWFDSPAAGVEAERQRLVGVEAALKAAARVSDEQALQYHERQAQFLRLKVARVATQAHGALQLEDQPTSEGDSDEDQAAQADQAPPQPGTPALAAGDPAQRRDSVLAAGSQDRRGPRDA